MKTTSPEETFARAQAFIDTLKPSSTHATVVGLSGDLGSGKTTFVQGIAQALGIEDTVTSPTFVIEKIYEVDDKPFSRLIHIDAYRLESGRELLSLGWEELLENPKHVVVIEWPERVKEVLPKYTQTITFTFVDETTRAIAFENHKHQ